MTTSHNVVTDFRKQFEQAGFGVTEAKGAPGRLALRKGSCMRTLERKADGSWALAGPPFFVIRGLYCELEDRGYQKFWYYQGKRFPIRKSELETLHRFEEEVRTILGVRSLYNEGLGTTCARSVYDRLSGRPDR